MNAALRGKDMSLWLATTDSTNYSQLVHDDELYDVVVVGGGITGIVVAYLLRLRGLKVVIVERGRIVEWTTGGTTAKLSAQHYLIYDYLIHRHSHETATAFARANLNGIAAIKRISDELGIDCDFSWRDAYVYTQRDDKVEAINNEVVAAMSLGLPASFETTTDLPFEVTAAIKFSNQAQFHPRKFLLPLAERFVAAGGVIYEQTEAVDIIPGHPHTISTKQGTLLGRSVVQASGEPFWGGDVLDGRMWTKMSYGLAVTLADGSAYPNGMYITTDQPMRTIRSAPYKGGHVMIYGGESHEYDEKSYDPDVRYRNLIRDVHASFNVDEVLYRWLAGDFMPYDRIPYIGALPGYSSIYIATGYRAWGLAWAMSAAEAITGYIMKDPVSWATPFSLDRLQFPVRADDKKARL